MGFGDDNGLLAEFQRQIAGLVCVGVVSEVMGDLVRVQVGRNFTPLIPFMVLRAGAVKVWCRPCVGEQVVVFSSSGDFSTAVAGPSLFCDRFSGGAGGDGLVIEAGGAVVRVDAGGVSVEAGRIALKGSVSVEGDVSVSGDVTAGGVSLKSHVHGGVQGGEGSTSGPQ